jgi:hypothetical protein
MTSGPPVRVGPEQPAAVAADAATPLAVPVILDATAPAPAARAPRLVWAVLWYALAAGAALGFALVGHRVDRIDVRVPFLYEDDALLILPMVKATLEGGTHWRTDRLGAWGGQEMHDFPVVDHVHFGLIWLLGRAVPDAATVFNLYFLLGYPLAAVTAMAVLRHFGLSSPAAAAAGVLYACQPYHQFRGENHYFLSAYWFVPVGLMVALWLTRGRLPFFPAAPGRAGGVSPPVTPSVSDNRSHRGADAPRSPRPRISLTDRDTVFAVLVAVVTAAAGAYYAYFTCIFLLVAGLYRWAAARDWRAGASAGLLIAVVVAAGVANHAPTIAYQWAYGRNSLPTARTSEEADFYGLKIAQLLLPIEDHSLRALADLKSTYNCYDRPSESETERYSLGVVTACGLVALLARAVLPVGRKWPYTPLAALTLVGVLVGTVGGGGPLFNHVVSPQVRCYNRIAIFLAFLALFALAHWLDRRLPDLAAWVTRPAGRRAGAAVLPAGWVAVCWLGLWDGTPFDWAGPKAVERLAAQQDRYRTDAEFFARIEATLNPDGETPGPMVFQLPYVRWPESPTVKRLECYEHARGYLHTRTVRWSFGSMKCREVDEWCRRTCEPLAVSSDTGPNAVEDMLGRVTRAGFDGLYIDRRGFTPAKADKLLAEVRAKLGGATQFTHPDGDQVFFDLRPYRDWQRGQYGRAWDDLCWRERHRVQPLWLHGFFSYKEPELQWQQRWCGPHGVAVFVNPTDAPVTVRPRPFRIVPASKDPAVLHVRGGDVWTDDLEIRKDDPPISREFVIPPGRHTIHFWCALPASHVPNEPRRLAFHIDGLKFE